MRQALIYGSGLNRILNFINEVGKIADFDLK